MKNINELRSIIDETLGTDINFEVFLGVIENNSLVYQRADLDNDSTQGICLSYTANIKSFFANADLTTLLMTEIDDRANVLIGYNYPEVPKNFTALDQLSNSEEIEIFSFGKHHLSDVKSIAIRIATVIRKIVFFKQMYPVSLLKQNQIMLWKTGDRLHYLDSDVLRISNGFDVLLIDNVYYINDFGKFEKSFDFQEIADANQKKTAEAIIALGFVNDLKSHLINGEAPRRDMMRVGGSEVLSLPVNLIIEFAKSMQDKLKFDIVENKINLNSKSSVKRLIKLLNDDYLLSSLTQIYYDSLAKNKMTDAAPE
jgi:hypothetical protein